MSKVNQVAQDKKIFTEVFLFKRTRADVGREFKISPRTVGRAIERHKAVLAAKQKPVTKKSVNNNVKELGVVAPIKPVAVYSAVVMPNIINIWRGDELVSFKRDSSPKFDESVAALVAGNMSQECIAAAFNALSPKNVIDSCNVDGIEVCVKSGTVTNYGKTIAPVLAKRIVASAINGDKTIFDRLTKFAAKLYKNPAFRVTDQLYRFIEATDIEIADNGNVVCYKRVRENFRDIHTGTVDYSIGNVVTMPRNQVEEDPSRTCAAGLHVCSLSYLPYYSTTKSDRLLLCEVSPEHFVAIPEDYYQKGDDIALRAKARVCEIIVVKELDKRSLGLVN